MSRVGIAQALCILLVTAACGSSEQHEKRVDAGEVVLGAAPIYYRSPMDPTITSATPTTDSMGMPYIPVYASSKNDPAVQLSAATVQTLGIRTVPVRLAPVEVQIRVAGLVEYDERTVRQVRVRVEAFVDDLRVRSEGDVVKRGDLLLRVYSPRLEVAEQEFLGSLQFDDKGRIDLAEQRLMDLGVESSFIEELRKSRTVPHLMPVYAPVGGVVTQIAVQERALVTPEMALIEISPMDPVWVIAQVPLRLAGQLRQGDHAVIEVGADEAHAIQGTIDYVYPELDAEARTVKARIKVANRDGKLRAHMPVTIRITSRTAESALQVPRDSVIYYEGGARVVIALGDGRFLQREVKTGDEVGHDIVIEDGLKAGDRVVGSALFLIDAEASTRARQFENEATATGTHTTSAGAGHDAGH